MTMAATNKSALSPCRFAPKKQCEHGNRSQFLWFWWCEDKNSNNIHVCVEHDIQEDHVHMDPRQLTELNDAQ